MLTKKIFLVIFFIDYLSCFSEFNRLSAIDLGSGIGHGVPLYVMEVQRLLNIILGMRAINFRKIARTIVLRKDFDKLFAKVGESEFKNEIRRQYYLVNGLAVDEVSISFSVKTLFDAGLLDDKIRNASKTGKLSLVDLKIGRLYGLSDVVNSIKRPLIEMDIHNNFIESVFSSDLGQSLSRLQKLDLSYNKIYNIELGALDFLSNLISLDLSNNRINFLPIGIFDLMLKIKSIDLSDNQFVNIQPSLFLHLKNLKQLNLTDNQIRQTDIKKLRNIGLEELYI